MRARDRLIRIGISSCLLGEKTRWDGRDAKDPYIVGTLGNFCAFFSFCPEVAIGLPVPRAPVELVDDPAGPRAVGVYDRSVDVTQPLRKAASRMADEFEEICGVIFKSGSPSCGVAGVTVKRGGGKRAAPGSGIFARRVMERYPWLPVEEEGRLGDPAIRDNFLERVFALARWRTFLASSPAKRKLTAFHESHRLALMAHAEGRLGELDRLAASPGPFSRVKTKYLIVFMETLARPATRRRHAKVLRHVMNRMSPALDGADRREVRESIESYRKGEAPLIAPVTLLNHFLRRRPELDVRRQTYLNPGPAEAALRWGR